LIRAPPALGILVGWIRAAAAIRIVIVLGATAAVLIASLLWERLPGVQTFGLPTIGASISWLLLALITGAFSTAATNAERRLAREIGHRYLPPAVARQIERRPELLEVHARRVPLAIVFTDLAGFTTLSEQLGPEALGEILNTYLDGMTEVVLRHGGTLDKFIGDAVVCFWGAPLPDPNAARRALEAALDLQAFAARHRAELAAQGVAIGETRIGAHYGEAVVGNFGSRRRVQYTAMGDAMNLAARLESANKQLGTQVIASGELVAAAGWTRARDLGRIAVKGRSEPCEIYQLDTSLTDADAASHAELLARLHAGDVAAQALLLQGADDAALSLYAERANHVGWSGVYRLDSK
jgi:adenylate cyclase